MRASPAARGLPVIATCSLLVAAALGCGGRPVPAASSVLPAQEEAGALADSLSDIITAALRADAHGEPADSLYAAGALIVANGEHRAGTPRYAGIGIGGEVNVASSRIDVSSGFAWGYVEYHWLRTRDNRAEEGRATILLAPTPEGHRWRIVHTHSSTERPGT